MLEPILDICEETFRIALFPNNLSIEFLSAALPEDMVNEAKAKYRSKKRIVEWLSVRYYLRESFGRYDIDYRSNGSPYIIGSNEHIGISHSKSFIAIAISDKEIGIDVEDVDARVLRIKEAFFSEDELRECAKSDNETKALTLMWSAKESIYKLLQTEGLSPKNEIRLYSPETSTISARVGNKDITVHYVFHTGTVITYAML